MKKYRWTLVLEQVLSKAIDVEFEAESEDAAVKKITSLMMERSSIFGDVDREKLQQAFPDLNLEYDEWDEEFEPKYDDPFIWDSENLVEVFEAEAGGEA